MSSNSEKLNKALEKFEDKFGFLPFFDGLPLESMKSESFIEKLNSAVANNDSDIDITEYFDDGENL